MAIETLESQLALVQEIALNKSGYVADEIFPQVQTGENFSIVDWDKELKNLRQVDDSVDCKTDTKEVDTEQYSLTHHKTTGHSLKQPLCVEKDACGNLSNERKILNKTRQLANRLLLNREFRAIKLATDDSHYTLRSGKVPSDSDAKPNAGRFDISESAFFDASNDVRAELQGMNANSAYGNFNKVVMTQGMLNKILAHPSVIGIGLNPLATSSKEALEDILGAKIVIANGFYNDGTQSTPSLERIFPADKILFTRSYEIVSSEDPDFVFGIGAYSQDLQVFSSFDFNKGFKGGTEIQKIGHDITETVASYKAASLIKLT